MSNKSEVGDNRGKSGSNVDGNGKDNGGSKDNGSGGSESKR